MFLSPHFSDEPYLLGIGGLSPKSLREDALREMYKNANLTGSQAIINVQVTSRQNFYILIWETTCTATGIVIEYDE